MFDDAAPAYSRWIAEQFADVTDEDVRTLNRALDAVLAKVRSVAAGAE